MTDAELDQDTQDLNDELSSLSSVYEENNNALQEIKKEDSDAEQSQQYSKEHHGASIAWVLGIILTIAYFTLSFTTGTFTFFDGSNGPSLISWPMIIGCLLVACVVCFIMQLGKKIPVPKEDQAPDLNFPTTTKQNFMNLTFLKLHDMFTATKRPIGLGAKIVHGLVYFIVFLIYIAIFSFIIMLIMKL